MNRLPVFHAGLACVAAMMMASCGGGTDEEAEPTGPEGAITEVVGQYQAAISTQDAEGACRLLAPGQVKRIFRSATRCELRFDSLMQQPDFAPPPSEVARIELERVSATAHLSGGGFLELVRRRGHWYIRLVL